MDITIAPRFRRSIRIDTDLGSSTALEGFHCPPSFRAVLHFMSAHIADTGQGAFTWTGPYGGGKSSLALALANLFGDGGEARHLACSKFGDVTVAELTAAIPGFPGKWGVLPIVVERRSLAAQLASSLGLPANANDGEILVEIAQQTERVGLLVILDELGRALESAVEDGQDISLLQDLAELAARSEGRLIVIGILHQSFGDYAARLERSARDSWAKIQGRYVDISVAITTEESVGLIAEAMGGRRANSKLLPIAEEAVALLRPAPSKVAGSTLSKVLARCSPLHPVTAFLLPSLSRRNFGQNQRSVFSFLYSAEPFGLQSATSDADEGDFYPPDRLWDYLQANFEPAILASNDAKRWIVGLDALDRCAGRGGGAVETRVLKTVAVMDFLHGRAGFAADEATLCVSLHDIPRGDVLSALHRVANQSEVVFRRHAGVYRIYAGSDFDVDGSVEVMRREQAEIDLDKVKALADLQPILAKRQHIATGAMHWFDVRLSNGEKASVRSPLARGYFGEIVLVLPSFSVDPERLALDLSEASAQRADRPTVFGLFAAAPRLIEWCKELFALQALEDAFPELRGDPVARREIDARIADLRRQIENQLNATVAGCSWFIEGCRFEALGKRELNDHLSRLVASRLAKTPIVRNELLNCDEPSSNAISARTKLLKAMVRSEGRDQLGFAGKTFPAERGLFASLLDDPELHGPDGFCVPPVGHHLRPLWDCVDNILEGADGLVSASDILDAWQAAPIGLKRGLGPVYLVAYILSRRDRVATYSDGLFQAGFNDLCVEYLVRDPADITLRRIALEGFVGEALETLGRLVAPSSPRTPLAVARMIVEDYDRLVPWTKRTQDLSAGALKLRETLKRASDPNKLLFDDLPDLAAEASNDRPKADAMALLIRDLMAELRAAYPKVLDRLKDLLLRELDVRGEDELDYRTLRSRAENIRQVAGDLRFEAFVGRLSQFHGTVEDVEGLAAIAADKLPRDWNDTDRQRAGVGIAELSAQFLRTEALAHINGKPDQRRALALIVRNGDRAKPLVGEYHIAEADWNDVEALAHSVDRIFIESNCERREVILAALAEVTSRYLTDHDTRVRLHR